MKLSRLQKTILNAVSWLYHGGLTGMCLEGYRVREFDNTQVGNLEEYLAQQLECLVSTDILECEVFKWYHESVNDINTLDEEFDDKFFQDSISVEGATIVRIPNSFKAAFNRSIRKLIRRGLLWGYVKAFVIRDSHIQLVPEIQVLFSENNEYDAIKTDITERGIQDPVKVNKHNQLLAGYTRLKIAQELGLDEVPHIVVDVDGDMSAMMEYAILDNIRRRQLTDLQLVEYGMKLETIYNGRQGRPEKGGQNDHVFEGKTRDLVADKIKEQSGIKMSGKKYERLKTIAIKAVPEVKQKLKEGEITQSKALELANYSPEMQAALLEIDSWIYATFVKPELEADGKLTPEIKKKIALKIASALQWWRGDLLNAYEKTFGEKKCKQFMRELENRL